MSLIRRFNLAEGPAVLQLLRRLFRRYSAGKLAFARSGMPLTDEFGAHLGNLESYGLSGYYLFVSGWTFGSRVYLRVADDHVSGDVQLTRPDVKQALGGGQSGYGFRLDLPIQFGEASLIIEHGSARYVYALSPWRPRELRQAQLMLLGPFLRDLARSTPYIFKWFLYRDPAMRGEVKRILALDADAGQRMTPAYSLFHPPDIDEEPTSVAELEGVAGLTIVLPVYNAFDLLEEVLGRVERHTDLSWHLVIIEDASSDPRVRPFLREWSEDRGKERVTLIENETNLGFIRSVNRGFAAAKERGNHVVLLNSDALVPEGWASRLVWPLVVRKNVASVTPMSNDAEIFTVPLICKAAQLAPGAADRIDALARRFHPDVAVSEAPTGVGFCMAMNIDYLKKLGDFDTAFGRGYGEEVDWCQRARSAGGRHLALPSLFVEHRGGASFGSADKLRLVQENNRRISARYPDYDAEVQNFIRVDPLAAPRFALAVALTASQQAAAVPIYLAHSMGGGAENYLKRRIRDDLEVTGVAVVIRVGGAVRWHLELHLPSGMTGMCTKQFSVVEEMLAPLERRHIIYSCAVGDRNPCSLPGRLRALKRLEHGDTLEVLFHDFLPLSPSYCLLDSDDWFRGVPSSETADRAHHFRGANDKKVSLREWRQTWGRLISAADTLTVFSEDSRDRVIEAFPEGKRRISVRPHQLLTEVPQLERPRQGGRVIGVLGGINAQKGAAVLVGLSHALARKKGARLVLVGELDPSYALARSATIHGRYRVEEIAPIAARYGITDWLIPSIWPETFSYTTHEALATGLPVWCFDLGAQGDAVSRAENGQVVQLPAGRDEAVAALEKAMFATDVTAGQGRTLERAAS